MFCEVGERGSCTFSSFLYYIERPSFEYQEDLLHQRLKIGEQWKVPVKVSGYPSPQIEWRKDGELIDSKQKVTVYIEQNETMIAIYSLKREHSGSYTLKASNDAGTDAINFNLKVIGELKIHSSWESKSYFIYFIPHITCSCINHV